VVSYLYLRYITN